MTRPGNLYITLVLLLSLAISSETQSPKAAMTNDDVEQMLAAGLTDDVVVQAISANEGRFDVSPAALLALKKANVSDKVVEAMLAAESRRREVAAQRISAAATQQPANSEVQRGLALFNPNGMPVPNEPGLAGEAQLPRVTLLVDNKRLPMDPSGTQIAMGQGKGGSAAGGIFKGLGKTVLMAGNMSGAPVPHGGRGGMGMPNVARTWALPGRSSAFSTQNPLPKFEIEFGDIAGVDPDAYEAVLLKLVSTKDNWRVVSTSKDKFDKHGNDTRSDKVKPESKVVVTINLLGRGHIIVTPGTELLPGEYGLILHPKKPAKEYANITNANADVIFYSVWDFSVKASQNSRGERNPSMDAN